MGRLIRVATGLISKIWTYKKEKTSEENKYIRYLMIKDKLCSVNWKKTQPKES